MPQDSNDPNFTPMVVNAMGPKTTPRARQVLGSLITHIHNFTRENEITVEEWKAGMGFVNRIGQMSIPPRNEAQRVSDVIGLET